MVSPISPLLSTPDQRPPQKFESEEDSCEQVDEGIDHCSAQKAKCPPVEGESQSVEEDVNSDGLNPAVGKDCSLISKAQMGLRITDHKMPSSQTAIASPLPESSEAEPSEVGDGLEKEDLMYDLKLSPLNYNSISDEPPQLSQYDYIPISPASRPEESLETEQRPRDSSESYGLSVNPAMIFNQTETGTPVSLNSDPSPNLQPSDEPLVHQQCVKFTDFTMGLPAKISKTDPSAGDVNTSLDIFHDPAEPVEHLHVRSDLPSKAETETSHSHRASVQDCTLLKKDFSDGPPTPKPLIVCENEQIPPPSDQSEKQQATQTDKCSPVQQTHKETAQKKAQSNAPQGKVLCEICLMCFRTVPGLKRHKAMKHLVRAEKYIDPQSTTLSHQGTMLIYEASQTTGKKHKDDSQTCFPAKIDGLSEISSSLISKTAETDSVLEEMSTATTAAAADERGHQNPLLSVKAKKNCKTRKNKNIELNPDPFSDELLNILKTDILQAISPEFKSSAPQEHSTSPEIKINDRAVAGTEESPRHVTSDSAFDNQPQSPIKKQNDFSETVEEMKCASMAKVGNLEMCTDSNAGSVSVEKENIGERDESRKTLCAVDQMCGLSGSEDSLAQEILRKVSSEIKCEKNKTPSDSLHPLSCLNSPPLSPPSISPDLRALLDDDTTFSQLFPRDGEAKRKKCPRVYTKRSKRQKMSPDATVTPDHLHPETFLQNKDVYVEAQSEQAFTDKQTNHCDYETISIDDAIMLNMCHNNTLNADGKPLAEVKQSDQEDTHEGIEELNNKLLNPLQTTINKSTIEWSGSSDFSGFNRSSSVASDSSVCKPEVPAGPFPASPAPYAVEPCVTESVQTFHSIDIQNINTTFQLPEIQFFDSDKDIAVTPPLETAETESRDDEKSKKMSERRGRKRQDGVMKVKDKQYKCKVCFTWFLTLGELNFHKLSHNPSPPPTCYMCVQRKFSSREQLRDHLREKHAKNKTGIWTCGMCLKEISDVWMYNEHLREHATQFARKGQTQGSMLGIPGCFMQETAVKNFLSSIMQHRPSKASKESSKASRDQERAVAADSAVGEGKPSEGAGPKVDKTKNNGEAGGKHTTFTPLEVLHKTETAKSVEMHPNCKDPSRDCHHCGKQFPKPFKLQRHLVVHNLERIFLCHKCPVSYQEAQDLKDHLKRAHEEVEELDSKHTTLYTCELCADVMHVIKKSFICSTCNYTFSKKEQFDRHMEKHLSGGNKIFKFRGVLRPVSVSVSKENECDSPASKKRRILSDSLPENSSDSGIASVSSQHSNQNADTQSSKPPVSTADDATQTTANRHHNDTSDTNVKTEDVAEDYSQLLVELEKCIHISSSESAAPKKEETDLTPSPNLDSEVNGKSIANPCEVKEENESVCIRAETTSWPASKERASAGEEMVEEGDTTGNEGKTDSPPAPGNSLVSFKENQILLKTPESAKHELAADETKRQGDDEQWRHALSENDSKQQVRSHCAERESGSQTRDAVPENTKNNNANNSTKSTESAPVLHSRAPHNTSTSSEDKDSAKQQKKRKDPKSLHMLQRVSPPATQENFGVDSKAKKKFRPSKCANPSLQRKSDGAHEYPVLSSVRDDVVSNKIVSKCKTVNVHIQSKKSLLDSCVKKKPDVVSSQNGDYKTKKGPLGRSVHPPVSKVSSVPMNNSLNKPKPKMAVRSVESHSYRTAESQNYLLSQLFGQKLTSFKIPLRKDTSESIN